MTDAPINSEISVRNKLSVLAAENSTLMQGFDMRAAFKVVKKIIDGCDIALGVWVDESEPQNLGYHVIKGVNRLAYQFSPGKDHALLEVRAAPGSRRIKLLRQGPRGPRISSKASVGACPSASMTDVQAIIAKK